MCDELKPFKVASKAKVVERNHSFCIYIVLRCARLAAQICTPDLNLGLSSPGNGEPVRNFAGMTQRTRWSDNGHLSIMAKRLIWFNKIYLHPVFQNIIGIA